MQPRESPLAVEAAATLALACMVVRWAPASWLTRLLRRETSVRQSPRPLAPERVLRMIERVAGVVPVSIRCLETALAGRWMLARRGCVSTLVIGVRQPFAAHAWLEIDGRARGAAAGGGQYEPIWRIES